jgi:hypothetical protein
MIDQPRNPSGHRLIGPTPGPVYSLATRCIHPWTSGADPLPQEAACVTSASHEQQPEGRLRSRCPRLPCPNNALSPTTRGMINRGLRSVRPDRMGSRCRSAQSPPAADQARLGGGRSPHHRQKRADSLPVLRTPPWPWLARAQPAPRASWRSHPVVGGHIHWRLPGQSRSAPAYRPDRGLPCPEE